MIYFDNAATTYKKPSEVYRAIYENMINYGANAGRGGHSLSLKAGEIINETRMILCDFFGIENPERLAFFQNATYALNTGIKGVLRRGDHVVTTSMEHNAVLRPIAELAKQGLIEYTQVQANEKGEISKSDIEKALRYKTKLIVMTHASNVCGNIYDIKEIGALAKERGIIFLVDAAQSAGLLELNATFADMFAFSGHKGLMGAQGTGCLYVRDGLDVKTLIQGGTGSMSESLYHPDIMPDKFECGTQNMPAISALSEGVKFVQKIGKKELLEHEQNLSEYFVNEVQNISGTIVYGTQSSKERTGVVSINIKNFDANIIADRLSADYGICVRSGLHCAPSAHKTLNTIDRGTLRFSFGLYNTKQEIDRAVFALNKIATSLSE
ncbi:MAG: aminotransferase class V-fold PLP-dependent enzyme [Clostridia bacterium]|nr:aminotransferase class V-fold PLP-dependent enzyme [Clostridia bacterium]